MVEGLLLALTKSVLVLMYLLMEQVGVLEPGVVEPGDLPVRLVI